MKRFTMKIATQFVSPLKALVVFLGFISSTQAGVYDDFQSYTNTQVLATATSNTVAGSPWGRFGLATSVNPTAFTNQGVAGSVAGRYTLGWGLGPNASLVFWFPSPTNLVFAPGIRIDLRVTNTVVGLSNTVVKAGFEEPDGTIWQTTLSLSPVLTNAVYQTFTLNLIQSEMERTAGTGAFDLSSVRDLRIRFENAGGTGTQQIFLDNFQAIPEPSTLVLAGLGLSFSAWLIRRRRR